MNILVVCQYYYPENFQITPICEALVENGHKVTVLTGLPNYPSGIIPDDYKKNHRNEIVNGVHVIRCYEIGRKKGAAYLALNYLSYVYSSSKKINKLPGDFDIIFVYQLSPVLMALPALKYKKKYHTPLLLYCCDLWPESVKMYIKDERNPVFWWVKKISRRVYNACDQIACQSSSFIPYMKRVHNIPGEKLKYIPAFADDAYLNIDFTPDNEIVDFVFLGNLGIAQDLFSVLDAIEKIKNLPGFMVHFVGDGTVLNDMKKYVSEHELEKVVTFYGRRPVDEMPEYYKLADACLVSLKADNEIGLTLPGKVQGYMAAGKPIIAMMKGSAKEVIEAADCGVCVEASNSEELARTMQDFIINHDKYQNCGMNGREYFKNHFTKKRFMDSLEKELANLLRK